MLGHKEEDGTGVVVDELCLAEAPLLFFSSRQLPTTKKATQTNQAPRGPSDDTRLVGARRVGYTYCIR